MKGIFWTDDLVERLKGLHATGISSSQIAAEMNCMISRNAVIGKINRLGLSRANGYENEHPVGRSARSYRPYKPRPRREKLTRAAQILSSREITQDVALTLRCIEIEPRNLTLTDLEPDDCRWPYGDGPFTFCGHPKFQNAYCAGHFYLGIGRGTASERAATRVETKLLATART